MTTTRHDLPDGQWVEFRDPQSVSTRLRRPIQHAIRHLSPEMANRLGAINGRRDEAEQTGDQEAYRLADLELRDLYRLLSDNEAEAMEEANDLAAVALITGWSVEGPVTLDAVLDLPAKVGDALRELVAPLVPAMFLDAEPTTETASPFVSSRDSRPLSQEAPSETTSQRSGSPTDSSS